jgi:hypothetical protein
MLLQGNAMALQGLSLPVPESFAVAGSPVSGVLGCFFFFSYGIALDRFAKKAYFFATLNGKFGACGVTRRAPADKEVLSWRVCATSAASGSVVAPQGGGNTIAILLRAKIRSMHRIYCALAVQSLPETMASYAPLGPRHPGAFFLRYAVFLAQQQFFLLTEVIYSEVALLRGTAGHFPPV